MGRLTTGTTKKEYTHYGLPVYAVDGQEYAYASNDTVADRAAKAYIMDSVWAFRPEFLAQYVHSGFDVKFISQLQTQGCEDANEPLLAMMRHKRRFVYDAINADGRGHFLASYDGEERDASSVEGLPRKGYAYRLE